MGPRHNPSKSRVSKRPISGKKSKSGVSKQKIKVQGKSAKVKTDKLDSDSLQIDQIKQMLAESGKKKDALQVLDAKSLKSDLQKDKEARAQQELVETDLNDQLAVINAFEF